MRPFEPLFRNPHVLTVLGNFWPRGHDFSPYPLQNHLIQTDPDTQVLVQTQSPKGKPVGEVVLLHGLEGSGEAGYIRSMAWRLLEAGFIAHRFHMRTCGDTEHLCKTLYHAGLTSDLRAFLEQRRLEQRRAAESCAIPILLCGFSLGGNVALKLAGELGATDLIDGVCAISTPIDLAMGVERIGQLDNRLYENRFLARMRERLVATGRYSAKELAACRSLYEIDDRVTAPSFGFGTADNYYGTQSAKNFLAAIRVPTLMVQAKDDTFIPFAMYERPEIWTNPHLRLIATEYGGHLGFLSRSGPRFWVDEVAARFIEETAAQSRSAVSR